MDSSFLLLDKCSDIAWRKKSDFDLLTSSMSSLSSGHSMSDLIKLVGNKVPMNTYSALLDVEKQTTKLMNSVFGVDNLSASEFLNASGKVVKILPEILQESPSGIKLFRFD